MEMFRRLLSLMLLMLRIQDGRRVDVTKASALCDELKSRTATTLSLSQFLVAPSSVASSRRHDNRLTLPVLHYIIITLQLFRVA